MLTQAELKEILDYNPQTGEFKWKINTSSNKIKKDSRAGHIESFFSYCRITIDYKIYQAHRLAWLYVYGKWPKIIDHINGNTLDNKIHNLRSVSQRENSINTIKHRNGHLAGTYFRKDKNKWQARISISGKIKYIGIYSTQQEAHEAYLKKLKELNNEQN